MSTPSADDPAGQERAILAELREAGYDVDSPYALRERYSGYSDAVPVLVRRDPRMRDMDLKETLLRNLAVKSAKPAITALVVDFATMDGSAARIGD